MPFFTKKSFKLFTMTAFNELVKFQTINSYSIDLISQSAVFIEGCSKAKPIIVKNSKQFPYSVQNMIQRF